MNKERLLKQMREDVFTRIGRSSVNGVGVIAIRVIPKGINPFRGDTRRYGHVRISLNELETVQPAVSKFVRDFCILRNGYYMVPSIGIEEITKDWYLNHSKNPNMRATRNGSFRAIKNIKVGEELTVDYRTYSDEVKL